MSPERFISVTHRFIELSSDSWLAAGEVNRRSRRSATLDNASYDTHGARRDRDDGRLDRE